MKNELRILELNILIFMMGIFEYSKTLLFNLHFVAISLYGKLAPGAESHYEICCYFPQIARTLHALESSIFIGIGCRFLRSSDLDLLTTLG